MDNEQEKSEVALDRAARFVAGITEKCATDKGLAARLRRADNPSTEYQSWEALASYGVDLEKEWERLPYATISAALAKAKAPRNGTLGLGQAIAACYEDGRKSEQAKARLRRLLACDSMAEVCRIVRPLFSLIDSKVSQPLDYARLLRQLQRFNLDSTRVKAQWAQEFYGNNSSREESGNSIKPAKSVKPTKERA
jgi:CRISPR system Cascade subunit CasB